MDILKIISAYLFSLVILFVLDYLFIEYFLKGFYKKYLENILSNNIRWVLVILFYLILNLALFIFVVLPANTWLEALKSGAFLGFIIYSLYHLANLSFIKYWKIKLVLFGVLWGIILSAAVSSLAYFIVEFMI